MPDHVPAEIAEFLAAHFSAPVADVALVGAGAWSRCYGFSVGGDSLVVRFGQHVDDYEKDRRAYRFHAPGLPVPEVLAIGDAPWGGHFCISRRALGTPLEQVDAAQWRTLLPAVADLLQALRAADIADTRGWGGWDSTGDAPQSSWRERLLSGADDPPGSRTHGWKQTLAQIPEGDAAFAWGMAQLEKVASDAVPRALVHSDLINRNVLVDGARITAVLDWGCSVYGDPLYDLAWLRFWSPWHPQLDLSTLAADAENADARLAACLLHIGLDHLAYNAFTGDRVNLLATAERMRALVEPAG